LLPHWHGKGSAGCGGQQFGLGATAKRAWAAQKSRKVTIPFCSALVRPCQGTVSPSGSAKTGKTWTSQGVFRGGLRTVRAEEHPGEQGRETRQPGSSQGYLAEGHEWKQEAPSWVSGKALLPGAGCTGSVLGGVKPQLDTALSSLVWPGADPVRSKETTLNASRGPVQPELSCVAVIYIFICLRSTRLLSPIYKLLFSLTFSIFH